MKQSDRRKKTDRIRRRYQHIVQSLCAAVLLGTLGLLTACARQPGGQPTVTQDDLIQLSTVQDVLEQDAGNGKNYAYHWDAEDVEATMAQQNERIQAHIAQMEEFLEKAENMTPEELKEAGFDSIDQVREAYEQLRRNELEGLVSDREYLEKEAALDPVVSPQEAANRAGVIFEELYGVDLSQSVLELDCWESSGDDILHPDRVGALRPIWAVCLEEAADGVLFSTNSIDCTMDATTGEILFIGYTPSAQELAERAKLPYPACFTEIGEGGFGFGRWKAEDPSFAPVIEEAVQNLRQTLSGSALLGGAQVADIREEVTEHEEGMNELWFYLSCDDGKSFRLRASMRYDPFITDGEGTPYPMRGFSVWADA